MTTTRREFLKKSAATGALFSTPYIWTSSYARAQDANSRLTAAVIGLGGSRGLTNRGRDGADAAARLGAQYVAICDVDDLHTAEGKERYGGTAKTYRDYRVMFDELSGDSKPDFVNIGTPDHWHVPIAIHAMRAGCDVFCEKPLTLTIDEGKQIRKVVEETGRVFQVGTQQRTEFNQCFLQAIAMVQLGMLGDNVKAYVGVETAPTIPIFGRGFGRGRRGAGRGRGGPGQPAQPTQPAQPPDPVIASQPTPDDFDWNMWLGRAKQADYSRSRRLEFRWFYDYSGGKMTDWGAHHIDIAQWGLGHQHTGPIKISGAGQFPPIVPDNFNWNAYLNGDATLPSAFNVATELHVTMEYADGSTISVHDQFSREDGVSFNNGTMFEGSNGRVHVNRSGISGPAYESLTDADREKIREKIVELYGGKAPTTMRNEPDNHMQNFFDAMEARTLPISDVYTHHRTMTCCHLCTIALMLGRELKWDPEAEQFVGDDEATALMSRKAREGFDSLI